MTSYARSGKYQLTSRKRKLMSEDEEVTEDELVDMLADDIQKQITSSLKIPFGNNSERICARDNHVYFNADINESTAHKLNMVLHETIEHMKIIGMKFEIPPPRIKLHVTSFGGIIFSALSVVDTIIKSPVPIDSYTEGHVASAGTFLTIVCKKRYMKPRSFMLLHQLSAGAWGKMNEIIDETENLKQITEVIKEMYMEYTSMSRPTLDDLMDHDLWLRPDECLRKGLIDEIV